MARKAVVEAWLDERSYDFSLMSDEEKLEMRRELKICGAKSSSTGWSFPCCMAPMQNGRCRNHGGTTPKGIASPHFKAGRQSRYMPDLLVPRYEAAMQDKELLNLTTDLALVEARLDELLKRVYTGEAGSLWRDARSQFARFREALRESDDSSARSALQNLESLLMRGNADTATWAEIHDTVEQRRKLVESESKRREKMREAIAAEEAMNLFRSLTNAVKESIASMDIDQRMQNVLLSRISERFAAITSPTNHR